MKTFLDGKDLLVENKLLLLQSIISKKIEKNNKIFFYLKIIFPPSFLLVIHNGFTDLLFKSIHNWHDVLLVFEILGIIFCIYIGASISIIYGLDFIDLVKNSKKRKFIESIDWILLELDIQEKKQIK